MTDEYYFVVLFECFDGVLECLIVVSVGGDVDCLIVFGCCGGWWMVRVFVHVHIHGGWLAKYIKSISIRNN